MASAFTGRSALTPTLWLLGRRRAMAWLVGVTAGALAISLMPAELADASPAHRAGRPQQAPASPPVTERPDRVSAQLTARLQGNRVEVTGERSEDSLLFANPDGTYTLEANSGPVRVRRGQRWVDIDTALVQDAGGWRPRAAAADMSFSRGGAGEFARLGRSGKELGLGWEKSLPTPRVKGDTLTYPGVVPGGDLVVQALPQGFAESVVLRQRPSEPVEIRLPVSLAGLSLTRTPAGGLRLTDGQGKTVASAPTARMWGADVDPHSLEPTHGADVDVAVEGTGNGPVLVLRPDPAFLADRAVSYPVTLDPTTTLTPSTDTWVATNYPSSQRGSPELKSGTYDGGTTKARSFLKFTMPSAISGADIVDTNLALWNYHSYSCTAGPVAARRIIEEWDPDTITWSTASGTGQPSGTTSGEVVKNVSKGYSASCPEGFVNFDTDAIVQYWADNPTKNYGFKIVSPDESDSYSWHRFRSANYVSGVGDEEPKLTVTYNSYPGTAKNLSASPTVIGTTGLRYATSQTPTLKASVTDPDGGNVRVDFEVWDDPAGASPLWSGSKNNVQSGTTTSITVPSGVLSGFGDFQWRVRGHDGSLNSKSWTAWQKFRLNTGKPAAPTIDCPDYPEDAWSAQAPGSVTCTLDTVANDGSGYTWELDDPSPDNLIADPNGTGGDPLDVTINPAGGPHTLYARARDSALNQSTNTTAYRFGVGEGGVLSPADEDRTQEAVALAADTLGTEVTYKYLAEADLDADPAAYTTVPTGDVIGLPGGAWPLTRPGTGTPYDEVTWNAWDSIGHDGPVQLLACDTSTGPERCSDPVTFTLERAAFGATYATAPVGPGQVSLQTGDFALEASDAAIGDLSVGRTHTTLAPPDETGAAGVFGPGWSASLPTVDGAADYQLDDHSPNGYVLLTGPAGETLTYTVDPNDTSTFAGIGDAADGSVLTKVSGTEFRLTDVDDTQTTWTHDGTDWAVTKVDQPGAEDATTYTYDAQGRVTRMLGPVPAGVTCPASGALNAGCRALELTYATTTTATGTGPGQWGDYSGQLTEASYTAYDPDASAMATTTVASFSYDDTGHLRAAWDPRITPALKTTYAYGAAGRLTTVTPPGLELWTMDYANDGRLAHVTRTDPAHGAATQAIAYDVPVSGAPAPVDLSAATAATWGQETDLPREGAGVFPASHVPPRDGSGAYTPAAGDWPHADLSYLDVNGRTVNTAAHGAGAWQVSTTEYDEHGNTVRELSPGNRAQALNPTADTDPHVAGQADSADRTDLLASTSTYNADGDLLSETGPAHPVQLASGELASAHTRTRYTYDEGTPAGGPFHLVTSTDTEPVVLDGTPTTAADTHTTRTGYDPVETGDPSGWDLGIPTTETVVMAGQPDSTRRTRYDATGQVVETRMPASDGTDAGTTTTTYYTATANGTYPTCGNKPHWAGAVCRTGPAAQPPGQPIPVTTTTYDQWGNPATVTETSGATTRTTTTTYDGAGRPRTQSISVTPAGDGGTPVPDVTLGYSTTSGLPTTTAAGGAVITTGYDTLGRVTSYSDADNNATTTSYTIDGQPATVDDGKGTYTYTYDGTDADGRAEHRGLPTRLDTGMGANPDVFTGAYDANGNLERQDYPNGLIATTNHDNAGEPSRLTYAKSGTDWMTFTQAYTPAGQVVEASSPGSAQSFGYDDLGRLETVNDTTAGACTTRVYGFDPNSNRTSLATYPAAADGTCTTTTTPTNETHTYDTADRTTDTGYAYDRLGRTTTVPASAVSGGADLTIGYHDNDMVATLTQNGTTKSYTLDPARRVRTITDPAAPTLTHHYPGPGDSPTWISEGTAWTRNILALGDGLAALQKSDGSTELQLTNLHGDIIATTDNTTTTTGITAYFEHTEYGQPRDTHLTAGSRRYEWLGAHQRSSDSLGAVLLMGSRLYNPRSGRFLSVDPVPGGCANAYEYAFQDPVNNEDIDGRNARCKQTRLNRHFTFPYKWTSWRWGPWQRAFRASNWVLWRWLWNRVDSLPFGARIQRFKFRSGYRYAYFARCRHGRWQYQTKIIYGRQGRGFVKFWIGHYDWYQWVSTRVRVTGIYVIWRDYR